MGCYQLSTQGRQNTKYIIRISNPKVQSTVISKNPQRNFRTKIAESVFQDHLIFNFLPLKILSQTLYITRRNFSPHSSACTELSFLPFISFLLFKNPHNMSPGRLPNFGD